MLGSSVEWLCWGPVWSGCVGVQCGVAVLGSSVEWLCWGPVWSGCVGVLDVMFVKSLRG